MRGLVFLFATLVGCWAQDPALPLLPDSFSANIEATFSAKKRTMRFQEFFDGEDAMTRVEVHMGSHGPTGEGDDHEAMIRITDHKAKIAYNYTSMHVNLLGRSFHTQTGRCEVTTFDENSFLDKMKSTREIFELVSLHPDVSYLGETTIRGIGARVWRANNMAYDIGLNFQATINVSWYFSSPDWQMVGESNQQPLRIFVEGFMVYGREGRDEFANTYEFVDFVPGRPESSKFFVPPGCRTFSGMPKGKPLPPIPDSMEATIEANFREQNTTLVLREYFDGKNQRSRMEFLESAEGKYLTVRIIDHLAQQIVNWTAEGADYGAVGPNTQASGCGTRELNASSPGANMNTQTLLTLSSSHPDIYYLGERQWIRGIKAEAWFAKDVDFMPEMTAKFGRKELVNVTWYFSASSWNFRHQNETVRPLRIHVKGKRISLADNSVTKEFDHIYEFTSYSEGIINPNLFELPGECDDIYLRWIKRQVSGAVVAVMIFIAVVIGASIAVCLTCCVLKKSIKKQRAHLEMANKARFEKMDEAAGPSGAGSGEMERI